MTPGTPVEGPLTEAHALLDSDEFAVLATLEPSGQPQLSVVWFKRDGDEVLVSSLRGRRKTKNLESDPRASLLVYPRNAPYVYVEVRGMVTIADDISGSLIHELSHKYTGKDYSLDGPGDQRVILRLHPTKVISHG